MTVWTPDPINIDYSEFLKRAQDEVGEWRGRLAFERSLVGGRWHPNGFMVFNIVDIPEFGLLRLHVWPSGERQVRPFHPDIHSHSFHLHSEVLSGRYDEIRYTVERAGGGGLLGFSVGKALGDGRDRLVVDDERYIVSGDGGLEVFGSGESHSMPAGDYHSTEIPPGRLVATLALLSRPIVGARDHLVGRDAPELISLRREVSAFEATSVCDLLW